jgi:hypothetical protein
MKTYLGSLSLDERRIDFSSESAIIKEREAAQRLLTCLTKKLPLLSRRSFLLSDLDSWHDYYNNRNRQYLHIENISSPPSATSTAAIADDHNAYIGSNGSEPTAGAYASPFDCSM